MAIYETFSGVVSIDLNEYSITNASKILGILVHILQTAQ
jgi:hypothetical protein